MRARDVAAIVIGVLGAVMAIPGLYLVGLADAIRDSGKKGGS